MMSAPPSAKPSVAGALQIARLQSDRRALARAAASIAKAANIHNAPVDAEVLQPVLAREPSLAASPVARTALT